jgi:hypothetical protein
VTFRTQVTAASMGSVRWITSSDVEKRMSSQRAIVRGQIHEQMEEKGQEGGKGKVATTGNGALETYSSLGLESSDPGLRIRSHRAVTASRVLDLLLAFVAPLALSLRRLQSKALD